MTRRAVRYTTTAARCGRCRESIPAGAAYVRDVSGTAQHAACRALTIHPTRLVRVPPADLRGRSVPCGGCGDPVTHTDVRVHRLGAPWHRACDLYERTL